MLTAIVLGAMVAQERTVTFTHPCAHSSVVLEAFGKEIEETIEISGSVDKDYFLVRFDDMPVEDAKAAIAKTLNAKWERSGETLYLTRARTQELAEEREKNERTKAGFEKSWKDAKLRKANERPYTLNLVIVALSDKGPDSTVRRNEVTPFYRLADRIMLNLGAEKLLRSPVAVTIYSTDSKGEGLPMPDSFQRMIRVFDDEVAIWEQALDTMGDTGSRSSVRYDKTLKKSEIHIERRVSSVEFSLSRVYDAGRSSTSFTFASELRSNSSGPRRFVHGLDELVDIDEEFFDTLVRPAWQDLNMQPIFGPKLLVPFDPPPLAKKIVADPVSYDPLGSLVSWPFLEAAEQKQANLVALLPDIVINGLSHFNYNERQLLPPVIDRVSYELGFEFDVELDCWLLAPNDPASTRAARTDRAALGRLLRAVKSKGWVTLSDVSNYAANAGSLKYIVLWKIFFSHAMRVLRSDLYFGGDSGLAILLYSQLGAARQRTAKSGVVELPRSSWPRKFARALLSHDWGERRFSDLSKPLDPEDVLSWMGTGRLVSHVFSEGLPDNAFLRIEVVPDHRTWIEFPNRIAFTRNDGLIGELLYRYEKEAKGSSEPIRFGFEPVEKLEVLLVFPEMGKLGLLAKFRHVPKTNELDSFEELPMDVQKAISVGVEKARGGGD